MMRKVHLKWRRRTFRTTGASISASPTPNHAEPGSRTWPSHGSLDGLSLSLSLGASQLRLVFGGTIGTATGLGTQIRQRPPEILATSAHSGERATESVRPDLTVALRRDDLRRACILCSNTYLAAVFSVLMLHCRGASINLSINTLSYTI